MSLQSTENECAANAANAVTGNDTPAAPAPRVSLTDIEAKIKACYDLTGSQAVGPDMPVEGELDLLSLCILVMENGFMIVGTNAAASPENYSRGLGRKLAYEDAILQTWKLEGYALRDRLAAARAAGAASDRAAVTAIANDEGGPPQQPPQTHEGGIAAAAD